MTATLAAQTANENASEATTEQDAASVKAAKQERVFSLINKSSKFLDVFALSWVTPILMMAAGDSPKRNLSLI